LLFDCIGDGSTFGGPFEGVLNHTSPALILLIAEVLSEKRPLKWGIAITYTFSVSSLILSALALYALRFKTTEAYVLTLWATAVTFVGMLAIATFMLGKTFRS